MVLEEYADTNPDVVLALVKSFEEASRLVYSDTEFAKEVARKEFPDLPADVVEKAIDAQLEYKIPAETVVTQQDQWNNLISMQKYLGNVVGSIAYEDIIDNSYAEKAIALLE